MRVESDASSSSVGQVLDIIKRKTVPRNARQKRQDSTAWWARSIFQLSKKGSPDKKRGRDIYILFSPPFLSSH